MRARWDSSKLDRVRTKVQELKKSLRLAERKLREARESLIGPELKKAFGLRCQVNVYNFADGLVFRPLRTASLGRYDWKFRDDNNNNIVSLNGEALGCKVCSVPKEENIQLSSLKLKEIATHIDSNDSLLRTPIHLLTLKVRNTKEKTTSLQLRNETVHEHLLRLNDKFVKIQSRMKSSGEALKTLQKRMQSMGEGVAILEQKSQQRKLSAKLEERIKLATKRAIEAETREGELETRVLDLEDSLEAYDMKIHRTQNALYRLNEDDLPESESCSVTMVFRRVSLTRQSSSASFKGHIPSILDSCGEESDISDQAFED